MNFKTFSFLVCLLFSLLFVWSAEEEGRQFLLNVEDLESRMYDLLSRGQQDSYDGTQTWLYDLLQRMYDEKSQTGGIPFDSYERLYDLLTRNSPSPQRLKSYQYVNCGDSKNTNSIAELNTLNIKPDPLTFPGILAFEFNVNLNVAVDAPLKVSITLSRKMGRWRWLTIPCIDQIGSCVYDDICPFLSIIPECPRRFSQFGIPCKCPFAPGNYTFPMTAYDIGLPLLPPGDYRAVANITTKGNAVACIELHASFV